MSNCRFKKLSCIRGNKKGLHENSPLKCLVAFIWWHWNLTWLLKIQSRDDKIYTTCPITSIDNNMTTPWFFSCYKIMGWMSQVNTAHPQNSARFSNTLQMCYDKLSYYADFIGLKAAIVNTRGQFIDSWQCETMGAASKHSGSNAGGYPFSFRVEDPNGYRRWWS